MKTNAPTNDPSLAKPEAELEAQAQIVDAEIAGAQRLALQAGRELLKLEEMWRALPSEDRGPGIEGKVAEFSAQWRASIERSFDVRPRTTESNSSLFKRALLRASPAVRVWFDPRHHPDASSRQDH